MKMTGVPFYFVINDSKIEEDNSPRYILESTARVTLDLPKVTHWVNRKNEELRQEKSMGFVKRLFNNIESFFHTTKRWRIYEVRSNITNVDYELYIYVHKETLELTQKPSEKEINNYLRFMLLHWYDDGLYNV
jgi:hypothetical protein